MLDQATPNGIAVFYNVSGTATGSDTPGDYVALIGEVFIAPGETSATVVVQPRDDAIFEVSETVIVTLTPATNQLYAIGQPNTAAVTISDNDTEPRPNVTINASDPTAAEQNQSTGTLTVALSEPAGAGGLSVFYDITGTATPGNDYLSLPLSITVAASSTTASIIVRPIDDAEVETDETVTVTLSEDPAYVVASPNAATVTISNDDTSPDETPPPQEIVSIQLVQGDDTAALSENVPITIQVLGDNQPLPDATIAWSLDETSTSLGAILTPTDRITDENGNASATLQTSNSCRTGDPCHQC